MARSAPGNPSLPSLPGRSSKKRENAPARQSQEFKVIVLDHHSGKRQIRLLQWRALCFRARDRDTMRFLCTRLCHMNAVGVARISWTAFFDTFYNSIHNEESDIIVENKFRKRLEFLIENCCSELRRRLLKMENFRIVSDAFRYNQAETFALFLKYMDGDELRNAREIVDRIQGREHDNNDERLRHAMLHRQSTID